MNEIGDDSVSKWIGKLRDGDPEARNELIRASAERLTRLSRGMLRGFPGVRRWDETGDVFNQAAMRLHAALEVVTPSNSVEFYRFAALQIRRQLIELARRYSGTHGLGANHESRSDLDAADPHANDPANLALWTEFHSQVESLPEEEFLVFDLLYYQGLSHEEAATVLGVTTKTIGRRWRRARKGLYERLGGRLPEE